MYSPIRGIPLVFIALALVLTGCTASTKLSGDPLKGPAPAFTLRDSTGKQISLTDFRGHPVALTFLYTHCPPTDECPLIAEKLKRTAAILGSDAEKVGFVAISVDPAGDTPASVKTFSEEHGLTGRLAYLLGSEAQLAPIWKKYAIGVRPSDKPGQINHTVAVYVIDRSGNERALFAGADFEPTALAADLRALLNS